MCGGGGDNALTDSGKIRSAQSFKRTLHIYGRLISEGQIAKFEEVVFQISNFQKNIARLTKKQGNNTHLYKQNKSGTDPKKIQPPDLNKKEFEKLSYICLVS